jgi:ATP-dependent Clp protease protease subunit
MYSALGITDVMRASRSPIYTVCVGVAASAGAMILAAGNKRFALPSTQIMVHCHWQSYDEAPSLTHHDLMIEAKQSIYLYDLNVKYYQDVTGQSLKVVKKLLERNAWMGPEEAKSINIIDTIGWDIQSWIK